MLDVARLEVAYGDAVAIHDASLVVSERELVTVVGPNGAGKTTLINALAGLLPTRAGTLRLDGVDLRSLPPHHFCRHGIALVPEGRRLFGAMTVEENLEMGCYAAAPRAHRVESLDRVYALFSILRERRRQAAGSLSGAVGSTPLVGGALRRGGTRGGTAALLTLVSLAGAALAFVPVVGYLEAIAIPALGLRLRRRAPDRHAGLRSLAKD